MEKKEIINVLISAYSKANRDYLDAKIDSQEEKRAKLCMDIFNYLVESFNELQ